MPDSIASFPFRNASPDELSASLARCLAEFNRWHGQAAFVARFVEAAHEGGVRKVLIERIRESLAFLYEQGALKTTGASSELPAHLLDRAADDQLKIADQGAKTGAIVILHSAAERFLWRMVRFGLVKNRSQGLDWIGKRQITIESLGARDVADCVDEHLEKWCEELNRESILKKWDRLVGLVGYPPYLSRGEWHFDREMLLRLDDVRQNAVHHDGEAVREFDLPEFANQLARAQIAWATYISTTMNLRLSPETLFGS